MRVSPDSPPRLKFRARRDAEGSRIGQERVDLVVLDRRVKGDLVVALVGQVCAPDFYRPLAVGRAEAEPRIQQPVASLELPRIKIRARVIRRVVLLVDVAAKFQR